MKTIIFGKSVQGASHKRTNTECQDSMKKMRLSDEAVVLTVADGHGSKTCPYSKAGSSIAVNSFCKVMKNLYSGYSNDLERLLSYLNRDGDTKIAQLIHNEWKNRVISTHKQKNRAMPKTEDGNLDEIEVYKLYGTTLVGVLITPLFSFALQIGDGDITFVDDSGARPFLNSDKILGTETHSLSKVDAWKKAVSVVYRNELFHNESSLLMLSTDGFSNSFKNEDEFKKACVDYYLMIQQHGAEEIKDNLQNWLDETSELGCGDDITLLLAYSQV